MTKNQAKNWYNYTFSGDMTHFQSYYERWKYWFDQNKYDHQYDKFAPTTATTINPVPWPKEKGNKPMYIEDMCTFSEKCAQTQANAASVVQVITDSKPDTTVDQRAYLARRVNDIRYTKYVEIAEQFHHDEPVGPKTVAELSDRLSKGLYTVALPKGSGYEDGDEIYWRDAFSWRTPETQFNKVGYDAAYKELSIFIQDILDQIAILDPKDGLALLDSLKKWKPSQA